MRAPAIRATAFPPFWTMVALFVLSRIALILLVDPPHMVCYYAEELYQGTIAQALRHHLGYPLLSLRSDDYVWGSTVVGAMAAFFFSLLGPTAFALKFAPICFFAATLAFWHRLAERHAGPRVAFLFALFFILSPPGFTGYSYTAMGFHSESILFTAAGAWLLLSMLYGGRRGWLWPAALGATAGFGLWFCYHFLVTLATLVLFWVWHDRRKLPWRDFAIFGVFGVVGFSPWLAGNVWGSSRGWLVAGLPIWTILDFSWLWGHLNAWTDFSFFITATALAFDDWGIVRRAMVMIPYAVLVVAALELTIREAVPRRWGAWLKERLMNPRPWAFACLYLLIFYVAAQTCLFKAERYHIPAFPFFFFVVALALDRLERAGCRAHAAWLLRGLLATGALSNLLLISPRHAGQVLSTKGYVYSYLPPGVCTEIEPCLEYYRRLSPWMTREERFMTAQSVAARVVQFLTDRYPQQQVLRRLHEIAGRQEPLLRNNMFFFLGQQTISSTIGGPMRPSRFLRHPVAPVDRTELAFFAAGAIRSVSMMRAENHGTYLHMEALAREVPDWARPAYFRGLGRHYGTYLQDLDPSIAFLSHAVEAKLRAVRWSEDQRRWFVQGVGAIAELNWKPGPVQPAFAGSELQSLPAKYRTDVFLGAGFQSVAEEDVEDPFEQARRVAAFTRGLSPDAAAAYLEGRELAFKAYGAPGGETLLADARRGKAYLP